MSEHSDELESPAGPAPQQDLGKIIGAGIVILAVLAMVVNLSVFKTAIPLDKLRAGTSIPSAWIQAGRIVGVLISLAGGGWLLWRLLRQRQTREQAHLPVSLRQAVDYTARIQELLRADPNKNQQQLLAQMETWQQTIEVMAQALTSLDENDDVIQHDLRRMPEVLASLERQLTTEIDPLLRADLEQMLLQRKKQLAALEQLQTARRRAEIQVERAAAVLGTIYSQLLTYRSTFQVVDYQRLADNVVEEVQRMQDYLEALHEVKHLWR